MKKQNRDQQLVSEQQQEQALEQKQQLQKKEFGDKELKAVKNTIATIRALYFAKLPEAEQINRYGSPVLQNPPANIDAIENEQAKELAERIAKVREEKLADLSARVKSSAKRDKLVTSKGELDLERLSQLIQHVESELKEELLQSIIGEGTPDAKSFKTILAEKTQAVNTQITQLEQETQALSQSLTEKPLDAEAVIQHRDTITRIMGALDNTREDLKREHQQRSERKELPIQEIEENGLSELIRDIERAQKNVPSILAQTKEVLTSDAVATLRDILSQLDEKVKVASQAEKIDFKEIDRSLNTINKIVEKLKNDKSENATKLLAVAEATLQSYTQLREKAKQTEQPSSEALTELDALLDNISTESKEVNTEFTQKEATQLDELMKKEFEGLAAEANQTEETPSIEEMLGEQKLTEADKAPINEEVTKRQRNPSRPVVEGKIKGPTLATEPAAPQAAEIKTTTPAATTVSPVVPLSPKDKQDETPAEAAARTAGEEDKELSSLREHITALRNKIDTFPDNQVGPVLAEIESMQARIESLEGKSAALTAGQIGGGMEEVSERKGSDTTVPQYNVPTKDEEDDSYLSTELSSLDEDKEVMESTRQSIKDLEGKIETQKNRILKKIGELPNNNIEQKLERLDIVMSNASNVESTNYTLRNHEERFQNVLIELQKLDKQLDSQLSQPSEPEKPSAFKAGLGKEGSIMSRLRFGYRTASSNMSREAQIYHAQECGEKRVLDILTRSQRGSQGQGQPQTAAESRQSWWGSMRAAVREGDVGYVFTLIGGGLGVVARDIRGVFTSSTAKALENERVKKIDACIAAVLQMKADEPANSGRQKDLIKLLNNLESDRVRLLKSDPEVLQRFQNSYDTLKVNSVVPSILSDVIQRSGIQAGDTLLTQYEVRANIRLLLARIEARVNNPPTFGNLPHSAATGEIAVSRQAIEMAVKPIVDIIRADLNAVGKADLAELKQKYSGTPEDSFNRIKASYIKDHPLEGVIISRGAEIVTSAPAAPSNAPTTAAAPQATEAEAKVSDTTEAGPPPLPPERAEQIAHKAPAAKAAAGSEGTKVADTAVTNKPWSIELATGQEVSPGLGAMMRVLKTLQDFNEKDMLVSLLVLPGQGKSKGTLRFDLKELMASPEYKNLSADLQLKIQRLKEVCDKAAPHGKKSGVEVEAFGDKLTRQEVALLKVVSQEITAAKKPNGLVPALASEIKVTLEKANQLTAAAAPAAPSATSSTVTPPPPAEAGPPPLSHERPEQIAYKAAAAKAAATPSTAAAPQAAEVEAKAPDTTVSAVPASAQEGKNLDETQVKLTEETTNVRDMGQRLDQIQKMAAAGKPYMEKGEAAAERAARLNQLEGDLRALNKQLERKDLRDRVRNILEGKRGPIEKEIKEIKAGLHAVPADLPPPPAFQGPASKAKVTRSAAVPPPLATPASATPKAEESDTTVKIVSQKGTVPPMAKGALQVKVSTVETNIQLDDIRKALKDVLDTHNSALGNGKSAEKMSFAQTDNMFKGTILGVEVSKQGDGPVLIATSATPEKNKIIAELVTKLPPEGKSKEVNIDAGHLSQERLSSVVHALESSNPSHTVNPPDKTADIEIKLKK